MRWLKQLSSHWQKTHLQRPELASMFNTPLADKWVAIDCEMTGLNPKSITCYLSLPFISTAIALIRVTVCIWFVGRQ